MAYGSTQLGIAAFASIKVLGYSAAGLYLNRRERLTQPHPLVFGVARAAVGTAVGMSYAYALSRSRLAVGHSEFAFYPGLIPIRFAEWLLVLWLFYRNWPRYREKRLRYAACGIVWSFVLDVPAAVAAITVPGGFWIC
jgi:hypothetical protein